MRVPSTVGNGRELPDAVFTFRAVDPQYSYWEQRWQERKKMRDEGMIDT
ncbi:MAG: hypothetical protein JXB10_14530 [Pirellulales bacterium]|nr:hypothetical protein [Pirellulales bacterium]